MQGSGRGLIEILSRNFLRWTEENYKKTSGKTANVPVDSNLTHPEYESRALRLSRPARCDRSTFQFHFIWTYRIHDGIIPNIRKLLRPACDQTHRQDIRYNSPEESDGIFLYFGTCLNSYNCSFLHNIRCDDLKEKAGYLWRDFEYGQHITTSCYDNKKKQIASWYCTPNGILIFTLLFAQPKFGDMKERNIPPKFYYE
jgi:hypothetical protein